MAKKRKQPKLTNGKEAVCPTGKPCQACDGIMTVARPIK